MTENKKYLVKLSKEYDFEGKKIKELDFSKAVDFTAGDLQELIKIHRLRDPEGAAVPYLNTKSASFALCVLQKATRSSI